MVKLKLQIWQCGVSKYGPSVLLGVECVVVVVLESVMVTLLVEMVVTVAMLVAEVMWLPVVMFEGHIRSSRTGL